MIGELVGSYRIIKQIGEGGMGQVFIAEHTTLGSLAAVKLLHPELSRNTEIVARFFNEAKAATMIKHPSVIKVFDFGQLPAGNAYFVMEALDGESLGSRIRREGKLSPELTVALMDQVVGALALAHERGIVHRDLKPDNLFLCPDPDLPCGFRVKVLDFGIAKLKDVEEASGVRTKTNMAMGTPAYMSPEQCRGAALVDQRSDVYSLGCIVFEMVTGRTPFVLPTQGDYIVAHLREIPPDPATLEPTLPRAIDTAIRKCLAKDPAHRYQSMRELAADLAKMPRLSTAPLPVPSWSGVDVRTPTPSPAVQPATRPASPAALTVTAPPTTMGGAASEVAARPGARSRKGLVAAGVLAACVTAGGVIALVASSGGSKGSKDAVTVSADEPAPATTAPAAAPPVERTAAPPPVAVADAGVVEARPAAPPDAGQTTVSTRPSRDRRRTKGKEPAITPPNTQPPADRPRNTPSDGVVVPDEFK